MNNIAKYKTEKMLELIEYYEKYVCWDKSALENFLIGLKDRLQPRDFERLMNCFEGYKKYLVRILARSRDIKVYSGTDKSVKKIEVIDDVFNDIDFNETK